MSEHPLKVFKVNYKYYPQFRNTNTFALADGALPRKFKFLIVMALDASHGAVRGVRSLAEQAMKAGATKEEIAETMRVCPIHRWGWGCFTQLPMPLYPYVYRSCIERCKYLDLRRREWKFQ